MYHYQYAYFPGFDAHLMNNLHHMYCLLMQLRFIGV